jgi:hypothetical protein
MKVFSMPCRASYLTCLAATWPRRRSSDRIRFMGTTSPCWRPREDAPDHGAQDEMPAAGCRPGAEATEVQTGRLLGPQKRGPKRSSRSGVNGMGVG